MERRTFVGRLTALVGAAVAFPRELLAERRAPKVVELHDVELHITELSDVTAGVDYFVDEKLKTVSDENDGLSWPTALKTIPEAVDRVGRGDRILVRKI